MLTSTSHHTLLLLLVLPALARADELPSPDAMTLGRRAVPPALVDGFRKAIEDEALGRVPAARDPAVARKARARLRPILDEAFPTELLAGIGATFLARSYTADELRALRAHEESSVGEKRRAFEKAAADVKGDTPEERDEARAALSRRTFTAADRAALEAFADSPLGKKGIALAPDLAAFCVDQLDRHWKDVRPGVEPLLRKAAEEPEKR